MVVLGIGRELNRSYNPQHSCSKVRFSALNARLYVPIALASALATRYDELFGT